MTGETDIPARLRHRISYAEGATSFAGKSLIRIVENLTGRPRLLRMAADYQADMARTGLNFWEVMTTRYRLEPDVGPGGFERIPAEGPLVMVANHPFGILDGMMMGRLLSARRPHFRIIANSVFMRAPELQQVILPISFDDTREARALNLSTRREAMAYLADGGAVGVFPGGTVSTSLRLFGRPMDPVWRKFPAKLVSKTGAQVLPVYFHGSNSRLFQVVSHIHQTLRLSLMIREFGTKTGASVKMTIGDVLDPAPIKALSRDSHALMDYLRDMTYQLAPEPLASLDYGYEFEAPYIGLRRGERPPRD